MAIQPARVMRQETRLLSPAVFCVAVADPVHAGSPICQTRQLSRETVTAVTGNLDERSPTDCALDAGLYSNTIASQQFRFRGSFNLAAQILLQVLGCWCDAQPVVA
jgi:hypothetical protein